jgi:GDP/UDP-N,N'-diacetylbacillosamine 2-epimerase (hydrolysing)
MDIGVLTSSRADYGIYLPLLQKMEKDSFFELEVIAFGTHCSKFHGFTLEDIERDSYAKIHEISSLISNDDAQSIATSYGLTALKFADFWANHQYEMVLCLGDRFEMSAAVQAGIPFGVNFIHLYGGETTLGAIDNIYRHQITLASKIHFTSTNSYKLKIENILGQNKNIYSVGSLSLDEMSDFKPINKNEFYHKFNIEDKDFALITFHPETIAVKDNGYYAIEMKAALKELTSSLNLVITMPNADTLGTEYRKKIEELKEENPSHVLLIENFGKTNYFSAMYYSKLLIGNTSSGIVEAASFGKYVVNVGDRQKGRAQSQNILDAVFNRKDIISKTKQALQLVNYLGQNIYYKQGVADNIIKILKESI